LKYILFSILTGVIGFSIAYYISGGRQGNQTDFLPEDNLDLSTRGPASHRPLKLKEELLNGDMKNPSSLNYAFKNMIKPKLNKTNPPLSVNSYLDKLDEFPQRLNTDLLKKALNKTPEIIMDNIISKFQSIDSDQQGLAKKLQLLDLAFSLKVSTDRKIELAQIALDISELEVETGNKTNHANLILKAHMFCINSNLDQDQAYTITLNAAFIQDTDIENNPLVKKLMLQYEAYYP